MSDNGRRLFFSALLVLVMLLFYGGLVALWFAHSPFYAWLDEYLGGGGVNIPGRWYAGQPLPFFDLEGVLSWRDCHLRGLDVLATNPCDPLGRPANYSPLFFLLPIGGVRDTVWMGLLMDGAFLAALVWLLRPQAWVEFMVAALACISHVALFALERANVDILIFLVMLGLLALWRRGRSWGAYGLVLAMGALKFYPLSLLLLAARERRKKFLIVAAISIALTLLFVIGFWSDLVRIPALMPGESYYGSQFGASLLASGVQRELGLPPVAQKLLEILMLAVAAWGALRQSRRLDRTLPEIDWRARDINHLLGGAIVVLACFCLLHNIDYRAVFLLATIPGLFALRRRVQDRGLARLCGWAIAGIVLCLYFGSIRLIVDAVQNALYGRDQADLLHEIPQVIFFLAREVVWWLEMVLFGAVIAWFLRGSGLRRPDPIGAHFSGQG